MGPVCCRHRGALESDGYVHPQKPWLAFGQKYLYEVLQECEEAFWFRELRITLRGWSSSHDSRFTEYSRWREFLVLDRSSPYLRYKVNDGEESATPINNLFDLFKLDFEDRRNPIATLIGVFTENFLKENRTGIDRAKTQGKAELMMREISTIVRKFVKVLEKIAEEFYSNVFMIWQQNRGDMEGLLLTLVVSGELYVCLKELAVTVQRERIEDLKGWIETPPEEDLPIQKTKESVTIDLAIADISAHLADLAKSTNFHRNRLILLQIDAVLQSHPAGSHKEILFYSLLTAQTWELPSQFLLLSLLLPDPPVCLSLLMCSP